MPSNKNIDEVKKLSDKLSKAKAIYFTEYSGLDVVSITQLRKDFDKPSVKGMILDGEVFDASEFDRIANLPSKDQLLSKLVGMLNSPMSKLSSTLGSPVSGLLGALEQLNSKKEG